ncbi:phospholipase A2, minor isoenzyme-like [Dendronephthya gigantea]|uniref:phospholipase A2, minor isoenzyme-like n=1 Tax=Dendronephthya gigantea TaxID=151771 RepID=UPI00106B43FA|nr:phospholipase A2, minor isoenzyme-like [Dendronephthya gigantea]
MGRETLHSTNFQMFFIIVSLVMFTCSDTVQSSRSRRSVVNFGRMVRCATGRDPFDFVNYGCHCGLGGRGKTLDDIDRCCHSHDRCYRRLRSKGICNIFQIYLKSYRHSCYKCSSRNTGCSKGLCICDRKAAKCFKRHVKKYNRRMKHVEKDRMC